MFEYEINGANLYVKVATSIKKNGSFRFREVTGIGGNPEGASGSNAHISKLDNFAELFSEATGDEWKVSDLVYFMKPREYYGRLTDGTNEVLYQYISTLAPGSGQQYFFSPRLCNRRVKVTGINAPLAAWIIKNNYPVQYDEIRWQDMELMVDIIKSGITPDMVEATLALMR